MDAVAARRWLNRERDQSPWLHEEVATRMGSRLAWFREPPTSWLHWEPVLGGLQAHAKLREQMTGAPSYVWSARQRDAETAVAAPAPRTWNIFRRDQQVPGAALPDGEQVAMLWSNMLLHQVVRPQALLSQWHGLIRANGFLMFSCLGPDSLQELRAVYARQGWAPPSHAFTDMHDWGDMLVRGGFAEPVMDMERIVLSYTSAAALLAELRGLGRNLSDQRPHRLFGRGWHQNLLRAIEEGGARDSQGRLLLTFEVIYGHAYKAAPRKAALSTEQSFSLADMRDQLRAGRR